jgi:hypothetical protein
MTWDPVQRIPEFAIPVTHVLFLAPVPEMAEIARAISAISQLSILGIAGIVDLTIPGAISLTSAFPPQHSPESGHFGAVPTVPVAPARRSTKCPGAGMGFPSRSSGLTWPVSTIRARA